MHFQNLVFHSWYFTERLSNNAEFGILGGYSHAAWQVEKPLRNGSHVGKDEVLIFDV